MSFPCQVVSKMGIVIAQGKEAAVALCFSVMSTILKYNKRIPVH